MRPLWPAGPSGRPHRRLVFGGLVVVAVLLASVGMLLGSRDGEAGEDAPDLAFEWFDGTSGSLADYRGRPLVVNFWASWCPSCVAELSDAIRPVQEAVGDRIAFLGINIQDTREQAQLLIDQTGVRFDLAEDRTGDLYTALGGLGMPFTVFIDPDGRLVYRHNGPVSRAQLTELIEHFLPS